MSTGGPDRMREYLEKRAQRIKDPASMGMEENAADMAEHDPELFRECYGEDPARFLEKYRKDQQEVVELREKYKDCKFSARLAE